MGQGKKKACFLLNLVQDVSHFRVDFPSLLSYLNQTVLVGGIKQGGIQKVAFGSNDDNFGLLNSHKLASFHETVILKLNE